MLVGVLLASCAVDVATISVESADPVAAGSFATERADGAEPADGPATASADEIEVGPSGTSHWHAAYVVRICDDVLAPFESEADPLGIHSHGDGLIHVHPFFETSSFERATLGLFAEAMGLGLADGALTLPGGGTWRNGDLCNGQPAQLVVDRWDDPDASSAPQRFTENVGAIRFTRDQQLFHIGFMPVEDPPLIPPSSPQLAEVSPPRLEPPDPWVDIPADALLDNTKIVEVAAVTTGSCQIPNLTERVLTGDPNCFTPAEFEISAADAITSASAVTSNGQPAVDVRISRDWRTWMEQRLPADGGEPLAFAIVYGNEVLTAPTIVRLPLSPERLVISGGLSASSAEALAALLNGD